MIHSWLEEGKQQEELYELLLFSLNALDSDVIKTETLSLLFQIRFMSISGFTPNITFCSNCKKHLDEIVQKKIRFDFMEGKIICSNCLKKKTRYGMDVLKGTLKQLFWINNSDINRAERIRFSKFAIKEGEILLESFIPFHIGRDFKSLMFLKRIRR